MKCFIPLVGGICQFVGHMDTEDRLHILSKGRACICSNGFVLRLGIPWEEEMITIAFDIKRKAGGNGSSWSPVLAQV